MIKNTRPTSLTCFLECNLMKLNIHLLNSVIIRGQTQHRHMTKVSTIVGPQSHSMTGTNYLQNIVHVLTDLSHNQH